MKHTECSKVVSGGIGQGKKKRGLIIVIVKRGSEAGNQLGRLWCRALQEGKSRKTTPDRSTPAIKGASQMEQRALKEE